MLAETSQGEPASNGREKVAGGDPKSTDGGGAGLSQDRLAVFSMTMSLVCLATFAGHWARKNANCAANAGGIAVIVDACLRTEQSCMHPAEQSGEAC